MWCKLEILCLERESKPHIWPLTTDQVTWWCCAFIPTMNTVTPCYSGQQASTNNKTITNIFANHLTYAHIYFYVFVIYFILYMQNINIVHSAYTIWNIWQICYKSLACHPVHKLFTKLNLGHYLTITMVATDLIIKKTNTENIYIEQNDLPMKQNS